MLQTILKPRLHLYISTYLAAVSAPKPNAAYILGDSAKPTNPHLVQALREHGIPPVWMSDRGFTRLLSQGIPQLELVIVDQGLDLTPFEFECLAACLTAGGILICPSQLIAPFVSIRNLEVDGILTEDEFQPYLYKFDPAAFEPAYEDLESYHVFVHI